MVVVEDFNTLLSPIYGHPDKKKINKRVTELNDIVDQMGLTVSAEYSIL
jgi:hypothetical protein